MRRHRFLICALFTLSAGLAPAAVVTETVLYEHDGVTLEGYLAHDDATGEQRPGVLVVHQWMGLSDNERMRAEMLAELFEMAAHEDPGAASSGPN